MTKSKPQQEVLKLEACKDILGRSSKKRKHGISPKDQERDVWGRYVRHPFRKLSSHY